MPNKQPFSEQFEDWRNTEFKDHMTQDAEQVLRVQAIESSIASFHNWMKGAIAVGSIAVGLFAWILLEKNTLLEKQQASLQLFAQQQSSILTTLSSFASEMRDLREDNKLQDDHILQLLRGSSAGVASSDTPTTYSFRGKRFDK